MSTVQVVKYDIGTADVKVMFSSESKIDCERWIARNAHLHFADDFEVGFDIESDSPYFRDGEWLH